MRHLKKPYPCRDCGEPALVSRRSLIHLALCERCVNLHRLRDGADYRDERAMEEFDSVNEKTESLHVLVGGCLRAVSSRVRAAESGLRALDFERNTATARKHLRATRRRIRWAIDILQQLEPMLEGVAEEKLPAPSLRLVVPPVVPPE